MSDVTDAHASAVAARASEVAAKTSEVNSKVSETRAKTSETNSKASETAARTSQLSANASQVAARNSEINARNAEVGALGSLTVAQGLLAEASEKLETAITLQASNIKTWDDVARVVRSGVADKVFNYGDQLTEKYTVSDTVSYDVPMNVVSFDDGELQDGEIIKTMTLQWHYATPSDIQFSQRQAFYAPNEAIPAGTYNVTMGLNWGTYVVNGKSYQFTLTQPVPAGGILRGFERLLDESPATWKVKSFATQKDTSPIETVDVTEGAEGTNLGTFLAAENGNLNSIYLVSYGSNRYRDSAVRQWLNSDKPAGQWWTPQTKWDAPPDQLSTLRGFLANFPPEFVSKMRPCKVVVNANTVTDGNEQDVMYDKVFLPSKENVFAIPEKAGEGPVWKYWQRALGMTSAAINYPTQYAAYKTYGVNNLTASVYVRLRSAARGNAYSAWSFTTSGAVNGYSGAGYAFRCAPACRIG